MDIGKRYVVVTMVATMLLSAGQVGAVPRSDYTVPTMTWEDSQTEAPVHMPLSTSPLLRECRDLLRSPVENKAGESLGSIRDIVLTQNNSAISYFVLSHGGLLGMRDKLFAVPYPAVNLETEGKFIVDIDRQKLEMNPGIDKHSWPNTAESCWAELTGLKLQKSARKAETPVPLANIESRRVTRIIGLTARDRDAVDIGSIRDLLIDTREGRVAYTVVSVGGFLGFGEKRAAVPWSAVSLTPQTGIARIESEKSVIDSIAFGTGQVPDLADQRYARSIHDRFAREPYWEVYGYVEPEQTGTTAWAPGSKYNNCFNPNTVMSVEGTIDKVEMFYPEKGAAPGLLLRVSDYEGAKFIIHLGPEHFLNERDFTFRPGEWVSVTGSKTKVEGKSVIIATRIEKNERVLELRSSNGRPLWNLESRM